MSLGLTKSQILITNSTPTASDVVPAKIIVPKLGGLRVSEDSLASEDSGRADDGVMHVYFIKSHYTKLEITLPPCSYAEIARVRNLCLGKKTYCTFIDPYTNNEHTVHVYNSNSSADVYSGVVHNGLVQGFTFSLIDLEGTNA